MTLKEGVMQIMQYSYVKSLITFLVFVLVAKLIVFISEKYFRKITKKTKTKVDDLIIAKTTGPISIIILFVGIKLAIAPLSIEEPYLKYISIIIYTTIICTFFYMVIKVFDVLIDTWAKGFAEKTESRIDDTVIAIFHKFSKAVFFLLGLLFVLDVWGIKIGPLLASLGIAGIAIAFALQSTLGNIFGGISLILDKTYKVGDTIELDDGKIGKVHDIGMRSTKIKTFDNEIVTIPNGKLADSEVKNFGLPDPTFRVFVDFGVEYGSNVDKVKKLALDIVKTVNGYIDKPEPVVFFNAMGDSSLNFSVKFYIRNVKNKMEAKDEATTKLYKALNKAKIGIPFPTRTVYNKKAK